MHRLSASLHDSGTRSCNVLMRVLWFGGIVQYALNPRVLCIRQRSEFNMQTVDSEVIDVLEREMEIRIGYGRRRAVSILRKSKIHKPHCLDDTRIGQTLGAPQGSIPARAYLGAFGGWDGNVRAVLSQTRNKDPEFPLC